MYEVRETEEILTDSIIFTIWQAREAAQKTTDCLLFPMDEELDPRYHGEMLIAILNGLGDRFYNMSLALSEDYDRAVEAAQMRHPSNYAF